MTGFSSSNAFKTNAAEELKVGELERAVAHLVEGKPALQAFCTRSCYVRFLRARSWNVHKATKMLEETLKWRGSYKPEQIRFADVAAEVADGKMFVLEHPDAEGRPVVVMRPRNETSHNNETRIKHLVYVLEQASRLADEWAPDGMLTWLVDFQGYSRKNAPPIKVALQTLHILQNHYPERLGKAVSYIPPFIFDLLWRAVSPFIDPVTHKKLVFINKKQAAAGELARHFNLATLDDSVGGSLPVERVFDRAQLQARYEAGEAAAERERLALAAGGEGGAADAAAPASPAARLAGESSVAAVSSAGLTLSSSSSGGEEEAEGEGEGEGEGESAAGASEEWEATSSVMAMAGKLSTSVLERDEPDCCAPEADEAAAGVQALRVA